jgi:predicted nucleic acid-binding protein
VARPVILDTGVLGKIAHPKANPDIAAWFKALLDAGVQVVVPEIADYELRRNLLCEGLDASVRRLDTLERQLTYLPLTTAHMMKAAELWASARKGGFPTADDRALDGDVILAAQALPLGGVIATENVGHLSRFTEAKEWKDITPASLA